MKTPGLAVSVVAALLAACGGGVDEGFIGLWRGTTTVSGAGGTASIAGELLLSVEEDALRVSRLCFDGTGSIQVPGSGKRLSWTGDVACPLPSNSCATQVLRYSSATIALVSDTQLSVTASATVSGCGSGGPLSVSFVGGK
jgi:hypothetical protein